MCESEGTLVESGVLGLGVQEGVSFPRELSALADGGEEHSAAEQDAGDEAREKHLHLISRL